LFDVSLVGDVGHSDGKSSRIGATIAIRRCRIEIADLVIFGIFGLLKFR